VSKPHIEIRAATPEDAISIALLGRITFRQTFEHLFEYPEELKDYLDSTFDVAKLRRSLDHTERKYWIALADDLPIGYSKLKLDSPSEFIEKKEVCQLQKIYVLKDFHSLKVGHQLQSELLHQAVSLGYQTIWLSVLKSNLRAINFYLKQGFKETGSHDFSIGQQNFLFSIMSKQLV